MHGAVHDFIVIKTLKDGDTYPSAEEMYGGKVKEYITYKYENLTKQPKYNKILDIGSLDICGNQRDYNFIDRGPRWLELVSDTRDYTGIDIIAGKNVDQVMDGHHLQFGDETFDLVLCLQVLEHDSDPAKTVAEAYRVLKKGCPFILTFANEKAAEHSHLGGGSDVYQKINEKWARKIMYASGFLKFEFNNIGGNYYIYAIK